MPYDPTVKDAAGCGASLTYFRYLEHEYLTAYKYSNIVLLRPSIAFLLMQTPDALSVRDALPDYTNTTHIFLPINDNRNPTQASGGSHWSLLLVSVVDGVAFHYDSMGAGNKQDAQHATGKLSHLLGRPLSFINLADSPQQENGSDCGVFVCLNMRHLLLKRLLQVRADEKVSMSLGGRKLDAREGRKEMLRIIESMRKEGERRRSRSASPYPQGKGRRSIEPPRVDSPILKSPPR
jgi:sentrin-specific protease 8